MVKVSFSTTIYEKILEPVLLGGFLQKQLDIINYDFSDKLIIINNVNDKKQVSKIIEEKFPDFRYFFTDDNYKEVLAKFGLTKEILGQGYVYSIHHFYQLYYSLSDYHFHVSPDCPLQKYDTNFIDDAIRIMDFENDNHIISAMPSWSKDDAVGAGEAVDTTDDFYKAQGFTDQVYLAKKSIFCNPIYTYYHHSSNRYPSYGMDSFERRIDSYMKVCDKYRLIHRHSYYTHER